MLNAKISKIEDLAKIYESGLELDSAIEKEHQDNMKGSDFARAYGLHQRLYSFNNKFSHTIF